MDSLVSIVTPFYNTQEYLAECIESVLRQTYGNWEYILVNNCSTDGSAEIADGYARRHPDRIRLIHTSSPLPQVQNYNFTLAQISPSSKYCKMVQADDWIFPDCVRSMVALADAHPAVGIVAAYELEGDEVRLAGLPYECNEVAGHEAARTYFQRGKYLFGTPTSLLYRADLVRARERFFDERYAPFEDGHVCFELLKQWNFGFVHQVLTFTRRSNDSILSRVRAFGMELFVRFSMLAAHGRDFLGEAEYRVCLKRVERQYFPFLARYAMARHRESRQFWEFHRKGLESVGYKLSWKTLAKWMPRALAEKLWDGFWMRWDHDAETPSGESHALAAKESPRTEPDIVGASEAPHSPEQVVR